MTPDLAAIVADLAAKVEALQAPAFIAGDEKAARYCDISRPVFVRLMKRQGIRPILLDRGKIWRRADLLKMKTSNHTFTPNHIPKKKGAVK
jgi:hypothetical protein